MALEIPQDVDLFYRLGLNRWNREELLQVVVEHLGPVLPDTPEAALPAPAVEARCELIDRRGADPRDALAEFPDALLVSEAVAYPGLRTVDRYGLRAAADMVLLSPPPSARLLDEAAARSGAHRLVLAWPTLAPPQEERFLPTLLHLVNEAMAASPYVSVARLAVRTGELEIVIRLALQVFAESDLLAIDEEEGELLRLRRRTDGRGIKESAALERMRVLLGESRAFRRFLRTALLPAVERVIYSD